MPDPIPHRSARSALRDRPAVRSAIGRCALAASIPLALLAACTTTGSAGAGPEGRSDASTAAAASAAAASIDVPMLPWRDIELRAEPVPLDRDRPDERTVGELVYRAGFSLAADDPDFGGFSGMLLEGDRIVAISDQGHWWTATLRFDDDGTMVGIDASRMAPLADLGGQPVNGRMRRDAEEIAIYGGAGGKYLVSFEGDHRTQRYESPGHSQPVAGPVPRAIYQARTNGGMEAMTALGDDLLVVTEDLRDQKLRLRAWLGDRLDRRGGGLHGPRWRPLRIESKENFMATAAATLPDGDVLLLQRFYSREVGVRVRLLRLAAKDIRRAARHDGVVVGTELSRFQPPLSVDNFEALDVGVVDGTLFAFLLADDNYSDTQQTLLFQIELGQIE